LAYQDVLYNTALRILNDDDQAADATQEAFLSAFRALNFLPGRLLRAWLLRTVTNACYDELRRKKRRPTTPLEPETADGEEVESPSWLADPHATPEESLDQAELEHAVQHCLQNLARGISRRWWFWPTSRGWITRKSPLPFTKPLGTVKSRLARARLRLRACLQGFRELLPSAFRLEEESNL